ncbi:MAG: hypothetical protein AB8B86_05640 [Pseudomonadales bacterium]
MAEQKTHSKNNRQHCLHRRSAAEIVRRGLRKMAEMGVDGGM